MGSDEARSKAASKALSKGYRPKRSKRSKGSKARRKNKVEAEEEAGESGRGQSPGQPTTGDSAPSTTRGGATSAISATAAAVHVLDAVLGLALVACGAIARVPEVLVTCVCCSLLLLLGASAGFVGRHSGARWGVRASAAAGCAAFLLDVWTFVLVLTSWDSFVAFMEERRGDGAEALGGLKVPFAAAFFVHGLLEAVRSYAMLSLASSGATAPSRDSACGRLLSLLGLRGRRRVDDLVALDDGSSVGSVGSMSSMRQGLLWAEEEGTRTVEYLHFVADHERGLAESAEKPSMLAVPEDRTDY